MEKITALVPEYYKKFECIGNKCEYTCCAGWTITVDKNTYEKYQRIDEKSKKSKKPMFSPLNNNMVIRNKQDKKNYNDNNYAKINLADNSCPFLDENNLCEIYKELGPKNMPLTCKVYPRCQNTINDTYEISLTSSCPEVLRLALLNKEPMAFENIEIEENNILEHYEYRFYYDDNSKKEEHKYFWDIRVASITILQDRRFFIVNRLILLGMMYKKIQKCIDDKNYEYIPDTIASFISSLEIRNNDDFGNMNINNIKQIQIYDSLLYVIKDSLFNNMPPDKINQVIDFICNSTKENGDTNIQKSKKIYEQYTKYEHSYILENFLVNEYFRLLMPFYKFENIMDSLVQLSTDYAYIQIFALATIDKESKLDIEEFSKILYMLSRTLIHNSYYKTFVRERVYEWELNTLGGLYTLIA